MKITRTRRLCSTVPNLVSCAPSPHAIELHHYGYCDVHVAAFYVPLHCISEPAVLRVISLMLQLRLLLLRLRLRLLLLRLLLLSRHSPEGGIIFWKVLPEVGTKPGVLERSLHGITPTQTPLAGLHEECTIKT